MDIPSRTPKRLTRAEGKQRTRALLIDAAAMVFAREGFARASVEMIAEEAGFSKGAVYSNFSGKDDLFLALLDRRLEEYGQNWLRVFAQGVSSQARQDGTEQLLARETGTQRAWTMLELEFVLYALREETARVKLAERYRNIREAIAATLERHETETGIKLPLPSETLAWLLPALSTGLDIRMQIEHDAPTTLWPAALQRLLGHQESDR